MKLKKHKLFVLAIFALSWSLPSFAGSKTAEDQAQEKLEELNTCRRNCLISCVESCGNENSQCRSQCTNNNCDQNTCYAERRTHDSFREHANSQADLQAASQPPAAAQPDAVATKIKKKRKKMKIYGILGAAATAYLAYKTYKCCSEGINSKPEGYEDSIHGVSLETTPSALGNEIPGVNLNNKKSLLFAKFLPQVFLFPFPGIAKISALPLCELFLPKANAMFTCPMCPVWAGMTTLAGWQTIRMFKKRSQMGDTLKAVCESGSPNCSDTADDDATIAGPPALSLPRTCQKTGGCNDVIGNANLPNPCPTANAPGCKDYCPVNDPDCKKESQSNNNNQNTPNPDSPPSLANFRNCATRGGAGCFSGGGIEFCKKNSSDRTCGQLKKMMANLGKRFGPLGGWPKGRNPFQRALNKGLDYNKLNPKQKKLIDDAMKGLEKQNASFAGGEFGNTGSSPGSSGSGESTFAGDGAASGLGDGLGDEFEDEVAEDVAEGVADSFAKDGDMPHSASLSDGSSSSKRRRRGNSPLTEQMKKMLGKFYGDGGTGIGKDPMAGQAVVLDSKTKVGGKNDHIFLMIHRRHRMLNAKNKFMKKSTP